MCSIEDKSCMLFFMNECNAPLGMCLFNMTPVFIQIYKDLHSGAHVIVYLRYLYINVSSCITHASRIIMYYSCK